MIMKESLKRLGIKRGSILAGAFAFAFIPLTFLKGNPTGLIWTHDHAARYIRVNSINLENHRMATAKFNETAIDRSDTLNRMQDKRTQLMLLEFRIDSIENGSADVQTKNEKIRKIERRIDRLYEGLDRDGIKYDDLHSATKRLMVAAYTEREKGPRGGQ